MQMQREEDDEYRRRGRGSPSASSQPVTDLQSPVTVPQFAAFRGSYQLATSSSSSIPEFQSTPSQSFYRYGTAFEEYSAVEDEMDPLAYNSNQFAGGSGWEELGASRKKKAKSRLSKEQVKCLETCFFEETKLEPGRKNDLAKFLGLQPRQVAVWFQNRRARCRSKQLEQDYEHLKKQYESLLQDKHKLQSEISMLKELAWKKVANGEEQEELLGMLEPLEATNGEKPTRVNFQRHDDRSMTCSDYAVTTEEEEEEEDEEEEEIKMSAIEAELSSSKTIDDDVGSQLSRRRANMTEDLSLPCATNGVEEPHYHNSVNTNYMTMATMQHNNNNNNNNNEYYSQFQYSNWERLHMQFQMAAKFGEGYLQDDLGCMFNPHVRPDDAHTLMACFQETHN